MTNVTCLCIPHILFWTLFCGLGYWVDKSACRGNYPSSYVVFRVFVDRIQPIRTWGYAPVILAVFITVISGIYQTQTDMFSVVLRCSTSLSCSFYFFYLITYSQAIFLNKYTIKWNSVAVNTSEDFISKLVVYRIFH
jgi:hypothetical protein